MFDVGMPEVILILVIALVVFGPGKLPEIGAALGKSIREFRRATQSISSEIQSVTSLAAEDEKTTRQILDEKAKAEAAQNPASSTETNN